MPAGGRLAALLLVVLAWVPGGAPACPALCTCYVSPPTVSCQANNFSSVPAGLPPGARRLFLQNNVIRALRAGTFGPSTVTLWLYSNNISSIQPGTFRHLPALEELDLGDNPHLRVLAPDTFHGLRRLQALHLYRCQLASLPSGIFRGLHSLQYLYLQENGLLYLQVRLRSGRDPGQRRRRWPRGAGGKGVAVGRASELGLGRLVGFGEAGGARGRVMGEDGGAGMGREVGHQRDVEVWVVPLERGWGGG